MQPPFSSQPSPSPVCPTLLALARTLLGSHYGWNVVTGMLLETNLVLLACVLAFVVVLGSYAEKLLGVLHFCVCLLVSTFVPGSLISFGALFVYISTQRENILCVGVVRHAGGPPLKAPPRGAGGGP